MLVKINMEKQYNKFLYVMKQRHNNIALIKAL